MSTLQTTTSSTRPTSTAQVGETYFETDTKNIVVWTGSNWRVYNNDGAIDTGVNNFTAALDGTNDKLTVPSDCHFDFGTGGFSITFWMRLTYRGQYGGLVTTDAADRLKFQQSDSIINLRMSDVERAVITYNPGGTNTSLLGSWHHIAVIRSGTTLKGYVDNTEYGSFTNASEAYSLSGQTWGENFTHFIGGQLDEIAVFNYGLSTSELSEIYNSGASYDIKHDYSGTAPLSYYRCGDYPDDTDSGGGAVNNGDTIGTIKNVISPGTHDMSQVNGATYSNANSPV
jgi:hypothetical protein